MHGPPPARPENSNEVVEKLVNENLKLAHFFAQKYSSGGGIDFAEALSRAMEGLLRAAQLFDREKGAFGTYATIRIKQSIGRFFVDRRRQKRGGNATGHVSLDDYVGQDGEGATYAETIADEHEEGAFVALLDSDDAAEIRNWLLKLDTRERLVIVARFGLDGDRPRKLSEIAVPLKVSWQRVHQIQIRAVTKLAFLARQRHRIDEHPTAD